MACNSEMALFHADAAKNRLARGDSDGVQWQFHRTMNQSDRDNFDSYLVSIGHELARRAGTQETRFVNFCSARPGR